MSLNPYYSGSTILGETLYNFKLLENDVLILIILEVQFWEVYKPIATPEEAAS